MSNSLSELFDSLEMVKKYPESSQKQVYLVKIDKYGQVILKVVKQMNERIKREIDIVNKNYIPGVPKVFEFNSVNNGDERQYYIIEEYIEGDSLKNVLKNGPMSINDCLILFEDLLITVVQLEKIGIVHRDIKPDNIICGYDGHFHLIDFGIARNLNLTSLTETTALVGPHTPGYGAPELFQYRKNTIDSRADLFSIGVVMYESIFGKHPFITGDEADLNEIWYSTKTVVPKEYEIPCDKDGQLFGLISTLMQKLVSKRPPTAEKALEWYYIMKQTLIF